VIGAATTPLSFPPGPWVGRRIPEMIAESARSWPSAVALIDGDITITYQQFEESIRAAASGLYQRGVREGDRVAFLIPQTWEHMVLLYAVMYLGAVCVPLNLTWEPPEIAYALEAADVTCLIAGGKYRDHDLADKLTGIGIVRSQSTPTSSRFPVLKSVVWTDDATDEGSLEPLMSGGLTVAPAGTNPIGYIMFTSGSTARPKGAVIRQDAALSVAHCVAGHLGIDNSDRYLNVAPLYHCAGLIATILVAHCAGASVTLFDGYREDEMLDALWREQSTVLIGFDVVTMRLIEGSLERYGAVPFRKMISGPGINIYDAVTAHGVELHIMYGLTEGTNVLSLTSLDDPQDARRSSNGFPFPGIDLRICDPDTGTVLPPGEFGEIHFRGWAMTDGYYQQGGELRLDLDADGFFRTGDYGFMDGEGRVYYRGRYSMMVKTGGENVSQAEVENFLMSEIPQVRQATVVGIPDEQWGEMVVAFVELTEGEEIDTATVRQLCRGRLAGYKTPKLVITLDKSDWPLTPTGKVIRSELVDRAAAIKAGDAVTQG
jgi:fatty-acyl-CoA synthase